MKLSPSDPRYLELVELNQMLVLLTNPSVHYNMKDLLHEDSYYVNTVISDIKIRIQEIIDDDNPFIGFINTL